MYRGERDCPIDRLVRGCAPQQRITRDLAWPEGDRHTPSETPTWASIARCEAKDWTAALETLAIGMPSLFAVCFGEYNINLRAFASLPSLRINMELWIALYNKVTATASDS